MVRTSLAVLAIAATALPAAANHGKDQFAAALHVEADLYTMDELIRLEQAMSENDLTTVRWILEGGLKQTPPEDPAAVTPFEARFATAIGIDPAKYTAAEVAELYAERIGHD